jgi:hypothetical protein
MRTPSTWVVIIAGREAVAGTPPNRRAPSRAGEPVLGRAGCTNAELAASKRAMDAIVSKDRALF